MPKVMVAKSRYGIPWFSCILDESVHVSLGARLAGAVRVGHLSWIGIAANVSLSINICCNVNVVAGVSVVKDIMAV